ncbi:flagellar assembly factor FliW [Alkalispirochaeta americana]|uniref:Flagellar assembly factor FliW n=1 Tax=Alkalispirochaeta americana TaxID=159291 RepID=A0A1N6WGQ2_9SPIO|nr:flagellar assembly protein FliW [Alkalispirochaeta americana]SIQ89166.1 flagellar assembly factor FliW [Alkalispirochaeta americana]
MTDVTIESKPYGTVTVQEKQLIHFPAGLFGFERFRRYALLDAVHKPFLWLQSLEDRELAFILVNPYLVESRYELDIDPEDLAEIGKPDFDDLLVFAIVTIAREGDDRRATCNLQGPLIVNRRDRLGRQAISLDSRWGLQHSLLGKG